MPRLRLLELAGYNLAKLDGIVVNRFVHPYQSEALHALGISDSQLIEATETTNIEAESLLVPTFEYSDFRMRWTYRFLRSRLGSIPDRVRYGSRIHISRSSASIRRIRNGGALEELLSRWEFQTVVLDRHSLSEQIEIVSHADTVIGAHGAGLSLTLFCNPGTTVIEIAAEYWQGAHYFDIAAAVGHHYVFVYGGKKTHPSYRRRLIGMTRDYHVDLGHLNAILSAFFRDTP